MTKSQFKQRAVRITILKIYGPVFDSSRIYLNPKTDWTREHLRSVI